MRKTHFTLFFKYLQLAEDSVKTNEKKTIEFLFVVSVLSLKYDCRASSSLNHYNGLLWNIF